MKSILIALAVFVPIAAADLGEAPKATIEPSSPVPAGAPPITLKKSNVIERSFTVKFGDKLILDVGGGRVDIRTAIINKVEILWEHKQPLTVTLMPTTVSERKPPSHSWGRGPFVSIETEELAVVWG